MPGTAFDFHCCDFRIKSFRLSMILGAVLVHGCLKLPRDCSIATPHHCVTITVFTPLFEVDVSSVARLMEVILH